MVVVVVPTEKGEYDVYLYRFLEASVVIYEPGSNFEIDRAQESVTMRWVAILFICLSLACFSACDKGAPTTSNGSSNLSTDTGNQNGSQDIDEVGDNKNDSGSSDIIEDITSEQDAKLEIYTFTELTTDILNPERGFYTWIDIFEDSDDYKWVREDGFTVAYAEVVLKDYKDKDLDNIILDGIGAGLARVREAGIKAILRFYYDEDLLDSDAPLSRILGHIAQLKSILQDNADIIAALQAGFIGRWGEWHSSTNGLDNPASREAVLNALLDALPITRNIEVRKPQFKVDFIGSDVPLTTSEAFSGSNISRIGHHNDCFLASDTDYGTYPSSDIETWKDYIAEDANFVSMSGETCKVNPPRSDCETAVLEMNELHWSLINILYHSDVINSWESQGCFDEIRRSLGYRLIITDASWNAKIAPDGIFHIEAGIKNEGYAAPYNEYYVYIVLNNADGKCYSAKLNADPRLWQSGITSGFAANLRLPSDAVAGQYDLLLLITDSYPSLAGNSNYSIRLANDGTWIEEEGANKLTDSIFINADAPEYSGEADAIFSTCY